MIKNIEFTKGNWEEHFVYASTERFSFDPRFSQEDACIVNKRNPDKDDGFDYTTIMTKEKYGKGTKMWLTCSFEEYGAPLITLTDKIRQNDDGIFRHSSCHEVVVWENGINVWEIYKDKEEIKWNKLLGVKFHVEAGVKHTLFVELLDKYIRISLEGEEAMLRIDNFPEEVYLGITGCENINRFYDFKIETENADKTLE